jgi:3-oxoacyl-[acyl-carrier-protein] synthase-1
MSALIASSNVLCAIGRGTEQAWASARTGIARFTNSHVMDRHFNPITMGLVPEDALLVELPSEIEQLPLPSRARRMLRLAAPVLQGLELDATNPVPLFLGLPRPSEMEAPLFPHFPKYLQTLSGLELDPAKSLIFPEGRAAALLALDAALKSLAANPRQPILVGGVDTFLDLRLLAQLDSEGRISSPRVMDGFIPGEGAAFLLLKADGAGVKVEAVAHTRDPGHRYGTARAKGEGLANAIDQLRAQLRPLPPVGVTFAGFNGENFDAKLWGVAHLRQRDFFSPAMAMEHPADKYGDAGAATGALLTALATAAIRDGSRNGPAFIWAASDHEPRACAVLDASQ